MIRELHSSMLGLHRGPDFSVGKQPATQWEMDVYVNPKPFKPEYYSKPDC